MKLEADKKKLSDGWRWVKLEEVCRDISDGTHFTPTYIEKGIPFLSVKDVRESGISFSSCRFISEEQHQELCKRCKPERGDVLYTKVGTTGIAKAIDIDQEFSIFVSVALLKLGSELIPEYMEKVLNSPICRVQAERLTQGAANRNLVLKDLKRIEIPLPPLDEQKRIAKILNEKMEVVERSRQATLAQLEAVKTLPSAYLRAVFNSPEAQKWQKKKLGEVGKIVSGITLGRKVNNRDTRSVPYLRVANVKDGYLDLSSIYEIEATEPEIEKCRLRFGDILLTEGGDPDKLGRGTYWKEEISECIHQNHIFRVRFDFNEFCPEFISAQIGSPYGKAYFLAHAKQTTGIATINQQVLSNFPLMMPSLSQQKQIAANLNKKMAEVEKLRKTLEEQLDTINKLPSSFLRQVFNGEL